MRKSLVVFIVLISASFYPFENYAQCSDAGICSIGGHSMEKESKSIFDISVAYKFGTSGKDDDVQFHALQLNGSYNVFDNSSVQFALPFNIQ
ncbi:MAG TPA: hypothetical protein VK870_04335, partial [Ignavibacteriaceae bacterium]|nr:hypothetical protein [Ignavibacteriaceae bacterium]